SGTAGPRALTESTRDELTGYAGAKPVRIGNGAFDQRQNDVYGAVLDSILLHTRRSQPLPRPAWAGLGGRGRVRGRWGPVGGPGGPGAPRAWRERDQAIWEARGEPQHYVSSKLMGW